MVQLELLCIVGGTTVTLANGVELPYEVKESLLYKHTSRNSTPGYLPERDENIHPNKTCT